MLKSIVPTSIVIMLLTISMVFPARGEAASAITCHCFQDRQFDPARPSAADPYLLATVQNRLMARIFGVSRETIVSSKMGGVDNDRLWVAHWMGRASAHGAEEILAARSRDPSWRKLATDMKTDPERLGPLFMAQLAGDGSDQVLAAAIVDQLLGGYFAVPAGVLETLRRDGAGNQELIMAVIIGQAAGKLPAELYARVRAGSSWGTLMEVNALNLPKIDGLLSRIN